MDKLKLGNAIDFHVTIENQFLQEDDLVRVHLLWRGPFNKKWTDFVFDSEDEYVSVTQETEEKIYSFTFSSAFSRDYWVDIPWNVRVEIIREGNAVFVEVFKDRFVFEVPVTGNDYKTAVSLEIREDV